MQMLGNRVAIQTLSKSKTDDSLIKMLDDVNNTGKIVYVGPECEGLKVGQTVCYGNEREPVKANGEELIIMKSTNIFGILNDEEGKK